jgi:hypothetical protein
MRTMRRRIVWIIAGVPLALIAVAAGTAAALPAVRHLASGLWKSGSFSGFLREQPGSF